MVRTQTAPPTDKGMWRKLLLRVHPDQGGDDALFVRTNALREHIVTGDALPPPAGPGAAPGERIDFDPPAGGPLEHLRRILAVAKDAPQPFEGVLLLLIDCPTTEGHSRAFAMRTAGATFKQLALAAHLAGFSDEERRLWYSLAEDLSLSSRHISHLISKLKGAA